MKLKVLMLITSDSDIKALFFRTSTSSTQVHGQIKNLYRPTRNIKFPDDTQTAMDEIQIWKCQICSSLGTQRCLHFYPSVYTKSLFCLMIKSRAPFLNYLSSYFAVNGKNICHCSFKVCSWIITLQEINKGNDQ